MSYANLCILLLNFADCFENDAIPLFPAIWSQTTRKTAKQYHKEFHWITVHQGNGSSLPPPADKDCQFHHLFFFWMEVWDRGMQIPCSPHDKTYDRTDQFFGLGVFLSFRSLTNNQQVIDPLSTSVTLPWGVLESGWMGRNYSKGLFIFQGIFQTFFLRLLTPLPQYRAPVYFWAKRQDLRGGVIFGGYIWEGKSNFRTKSVYILPECHHF